MYTSMLFLHWKQIQYVLPFFAIGAFALPLLAVTGLGTPPGMDTASLDAYRYLAQFETWLPFFPLLACGIGATLALSSWNWDHQLNHVYALSLPMNRWEYTLHKLVAGATLCLIPAAGLWIGANLAAASVTLPTGLQAYPNQLAIRFFFATFLAYSLLFAMAAGTIRTTVWVAGTVFGFFFFGLMANDLLADYFIYFSRVNVVQNVVEWLLTSPGPLEVFTGNWSLIDV